jgi:hypothetical protein
MSEVETKKPSAFEERLRDGRPLMECTIEPPFALVVTAAGVQIDAPCLQFNETNALGVLRVTFNPLAALRLRDALNQLQFAETSNPGSNALQ